MKIVCDACQAKYSIADEKIQGKAFKIRCKKCNHVIVVKVGADGAHVASSGDRPRSTGSQAAVGGTEGQRTSGSHAVAAAPASEAVWHVVVDGEQVGPLAESEIVDRLRQGKVNSDTLVWKEGFADWTQFSAVPELTPLLAKITRHPVKGAARSTGQVRAVAAPVIAVPAVSPDPSEADPFAAPTVVSPAGTADLFASSVAPAAAPAATSPFLFGGGTAQPAEPVAPRSSGGNGASTTHLTGQRNENSVLFSLANLEALAMPAQSSNIRAPSASSNTEGSGLIDIRSMAAMTLGDSSGPGRSADALPTFSTPQFSPVAPVILPLSTSGPPKWVYPVLVLLGIAMLAVGISIYKVVTAPPPGLPPPPPPAPPPAAVVPPAAAPAAPAPAAPAAGETKPSTEEKAAAPVAEEKAKGSSSKGDKGPRKKSGGDSASKGTGEGKRGSETPGGAEAGKPGKKGRSIDDMLGEVGSKKSAPVEEAPKPPPPKLVALTTSDIVTAMKGVQPKVQNCANQFKQPGTASAQITVAAGGKVTSVNVTGKFAGTPTGSCVEAAAKSAKLPACQPMTFPWPFTLSPR
jgi:predicted Zn finger-like uncharacterized protein